MSLEIPKAISSPAPDAVSNLEGYLGRARDAGELSTTFREMLEVIAIRDAVLSRRSVDTSLCFVSVVKDGHSLAFFSAPSHSQPQPQYILIPLWVVNHFTRGEDSSHIHAAPNKLYGPDIGHIRGWFGLSSTGRTQYENPPRPDNRLFSAATILGVHNTIDPFHLMNTFHGFGFPYSITDHSITQYSHTLIPSQLRRTHRWFQRVLVLSTIPILAFAQNPSVAVKAMTYISGSVASGTGYAVLRVQEASGTPVFQQILLFAGSAIAVLLYGGLVCWRWLHQREKVPFLVVWFGLTCGMSALLSSNTAPWIADNSGWSDSLPLLAALGAFMTHQIICVLRNWREPVMQSDPETGVELQNLDTDE